MSNKKTKKSERKTVSNPTTITVRPGEWGQRFLQIETDKTRNRLLSEAYAKKLARSWDDSHVGMLELVRFENKSGDDEFLIVDGQHRIFIASEVLQRPITFPALVYEEGDVNDLNALIEASNSGRKFSTNDFLRVNSPQSPWIPALGAATVDYTYGPSTSSSVSLANIIRGHITANRWTAAKRMVASSPSRTLVAANFLEEDQANIKQTCEAVLWWQPVGRHMAQTFGSRLLLTSEALAIPISLWREYGAIRIKRMSRVSQNYRHLGSEAGGVRLLDMARARFIESGNFAALRGSNRHDIEAIGDLVLHGMNYKAKTHKVKLFGRDGS